MNSSQYKFKAGDVVVRKGNSDRLLIHGPGDNDSCYAYEFLSSDSTGTVVTIGSKSHIEYDFRLLTKLELILK